MISINISELIWTVINFFLLLFLLNRFLYKPVISFMEQRQARIDAKLREEEEAKARIEENDARILEEERGRNRKAQRGSAAGGQKSLGTEPEGFGSGTFSETGKDCAAAS